VPTRRTILKLAAAPLIFGRAPLIRPAAPRVVVVGAGAFGGWTALWLARRGAEVTLIDAWGPGNMRASSGGETRVIRGSYGDRVIYTRMAARALQLWREHERDWGRRLFVPTGGLWMFGKDDTFARNSLKALTAEGLPVERPPVEDARRRWPQIDFDGISSLMFEPEAGYLLARQSCAEVVERAQALGATWRIGSADLMGGDLSRPMSRLNLQGGGQLTADIYVFACGPWLGRLFPDVIGSRVRPTRQATFYFGAPAGDPRFQEDQLPVWVDYRDRLIYGIPGNAHRGFKLADDTLGSDFDPTSGERAINDAEVADARAFLKQRFPALASAPMLGGEVCQYENSPDSHFIVDRHPAAPNVWIVGGGSGHGFKMGPALGEMVAGLVLSDGTPDPQLRLSRFDKK
jgi:glycine/D-amino acid oxidase-like deaminating enzyme